MSTACSTLCHLRSGFNLLLYKKLPSHMRLGATKHTTVLRFWEDPRTSPQPQDSRARVSFEVSHQTHAEQRRGALNINAASLYYCRLRWTLDVAFLGDSKTIHLIVDRNKCIDDHLLSVCVCVCVCVSNNHNLQTKLIAFIFQFLKCRAICYYVQEGCRRYGMWLT